MFFFCKVLIKCFVLFVDKMSEAEENKATIPGIWLVIRLAPSKETIEKLRCSRSDRVKNTTTSWRIVEVGAKFPIEVDRDFLLSFSLARPTVPPIHVRREERLSTARQCFASLHVLVTTQRRFWTGRKRYVDARRFRFCRRLEKTHQLWRGSVDSTETRCGEQRCLATSNFTAQWLERASARLGTETSRIDRQKCHELETFSLLLLLNKIRSHLKRPLRL